MPSDKPEIKGGPTIIKSWISHETEVKCEAEGFPAPEIVWSRKGKVTSSTTPYSCVSTLKFTPEEKNEFGILLCSAKNLLGTAKKNVTVKQLGKEIFYNFTLKTVFDQMERRKTQKNNVNHVLIAIFLEMFSLTNKLNSN